LGMDVKIADIESGSDPADIMKVDVENWKDVIKNSKHIIEIITNQIDMESDERKKGKMVSAQLIPYLHSIASDIDRAHFIKMVSDVLGIKEESIINEVVKYTPEDEIVSLNEDVKVKEKDIYGIERQIIGIWCLEDSRDEPQINLEGFEDKLKEIIGKEYDSVKKKVMIDKDQLIFEAEKMFSKALGDKKLLTKIITDLFANLKLKYLNIQREKLRRELNQAELDKNDKVAEGKLKEINKISKEINNLT
jgi:hypothetical protein